MKVAIIVITYNISSQIFLLQMAAIRKYCADDYEIFIFDNSDNLELAEHIRYHSEQQGTQYRKISASSNNGSDSHSWASNFAYQTVKDDYNYFAYFDHDLLPLKMFSVCGILGGGHIIAGLGQGALKKYFWPGIVMFHLEGYEKDIIDFRPSEQFRLDTGGNLYKIIEKYGEESCIFFNEAYHQNPYFNSKKGNTYATINDGMFLHCIAASNWKGEDRHDERINTLVNIIREKTGL